MCLANRLLYLCLCLESVAGPGHQSSLQREPRGASVNFVGNSCIPIKFTAAGAAWYQAESEGWNDARTCNRRLTKRCRVHRRFRVLESFSKTILMNPRWRLELVQHGLQSDCKHWWTRELDPARCAKEKGSLLLHFKIEGVRGWNRVSADISALYPSWFVCIYSAESESRAITHTWSQPRCCYRLSLTSLYYRKTRCTLLALQSVSVQRSLVLGVGQKFATDWYHHSTFVDKRKCWKVSWKVTMTNGAYRRFRRATKQQIVFLLVDIEA